MIEIAILESPDIDSIGVHKFNLNRIKLGTKRNSNLIIYDKGLYKKKILILIKNDRCIIKCDHLSFYIDGKQYLGSRAISINEQLTIGNTKLSVTKYKAEEYFSGAITDYISSRKNDIYMEDPPLYELIEEIELELLDLEKNK